MARRRRNGKQNVMQLCNRSTPDGASFIGVPSIRPSIYQRIYRFDLLARAVKRYSMTVGVSPIVDVINFQLSDIPDISQYTALFDRYRIKGVSVVFVNRGTQTYIGNSSGDVPYITTAIDYNDNSTALVPADRYQTCLTTQMTTTFVRKFVPQKALPVYNGISSAYVAGRNDQWLDCGFTGVPHYQLVVNIGATSLDAQFVYEVDVLYTVEFDTVR